MIRPYVPGDDVRRIDWNVTARTAEPHVRVDLAERVLVTWLVLDNSISMQFGTADRRKADVAEGVAIALGHLATRRGNRLGVVTFGGRRAAGAASEAGPRRARRATRRRCTKSASGSGEKEAGATSLAEAIGAPARSRASARSPSSCPTSAGPRDWHSAAARARGSPRGHRGGGPGPARAGADERRAALARRSRDGPPAPRRHAEPPPAGAIRGGGAAERDEVARDAHVRRRPPRRLSTTGRLAPLARRLPPAEAAAERVTLHLADRAARALRAPCSSCALRVERAAASPRQAAFGNPDLLPNVVDRAPGRLRFLPLAVLLVGLGAMIVGVARPHATVSVPREEATVILAIDISRSMKADDIEPTRLQAAVNAAKTFLVEVPEKFRVGVVSFSTRAAVGVPPTEDRELVVAALDSIRPGEGTALGDAVALVGPGRPAEQPSRARRLDAAARDPAPVGREARRREDRAPGRRGAGEERGIPVYTVLVGTPNGVVEEPLTGGFQRSIRVPARSRDAPALLHRDRRRVLRRARRRAPAVVYEELGSRLGERKELREMTDVFAARRGGAPPRRRRALGVPLPEGSVRRVLLILVRARPGCGRADGRGVSLRCKRVRRPAGVRARGRAVGRRRRRRGTSRLGEWHLTCPRGYVVGGVDAVLSRREIDISFLGMIGSPVNPGITTSRAVTFVGTWVGRAAVLHLPALHRLHALRGRRDADTDLRERVPARQPDDSAGRRRCACGRVARRSRRAAAPASSSSAPAHAFGFDTRDAAECEPRGDRLRARSIRGGRVVVRVRGDAELGGVRAVVQVQALCARTHELRESLVPLQPAVARQGSRAVDARRAAAGPLCGSLSRTSTCSLRCASGRSWPRLVPAALFALSLALLLARARPPACRADGAERAGDGDPRRRHVALDAGQGRRADAPRGGAAGARRVPRPGARPAERRSRRVRGRGAGRRRRRRRITTSCGRRSRRSTPSSSSAEPRSATHSRPRSSSASSRPGGAVEAGDRARRVPASQRTSSSEPRAGGRGRGGVGAEPASILFLSDGAQTRGILQPLEGAALAQEACIPVYTIALGTPDRLDRRAARSAAFGGGAERPDSRAAGSRDAPPDRGDDRRRVLRGAHADALENAYSNLSSRLGREPGETEVTFIFVGLAGAVPAPAAGLVATVVAPRLP